MGLTQAKTICLAALFTFLPSEPRAGEKSYAFIVSGDCQYLAKNSSRPRALDPYSEQANSRFIRLLKGIAGKSIGKKLCGTKNLEIWVV